MLGSSVCPTRVRPPGGPPQPAGLTYNYVKPSNNYVLVLTWWSSMAIFSSISWNVTLAYTV